MANSETIFSKVFRGFSPEEVIAYIDELNAAHRSAKSESDARINALENELENFKNAEDENAALKALLADKDSIISEKDGQIERLNSDTENQRLAIVEQSEKICQLEEALASLKSSLEAANIKNNAMEQNSKEYESMLADVESILSSARRKAQELVEAAEEKSKSIIAAAEKNAADIVEAAEVNAKSKSERIMAESDEHLSENIKKVKYLYRRQDELAEIFKDHKAKVDSFFASIDIPEKE